MNTVIHDQAERDQALNPTQSFIVQAPAGSGKTELLTQRVLILLAEVKQPEEILAITFTKKSAAEMKARIINALTLAQKGIQPISAHTEKTFQLAQRVLKQNDRYQWNLLDNPNRLRIQTIDSFNSSLTKHLPLLSHFGAPPSIAEDAVSLYRQAIYEFLTHLEEDHAWSEAIATLLLHLDNDLNKVAELLMTLLAKRDQWLPHITPNLYNPFLRSELEDNLRLLTQDILSTINQTFPKKHLEELLVLLQIASNHLLKENTPSFISYHAAVPENMIEKKQFWLSVSNLLLTSQHEWRKRIDKTMGFPASSCKDKQTKLQLMDEKNRMIDLLTELSQYERFRAALIELRLAPALHYSEQQWKTLEALHQVLCVAVAQLKVVFQQTGKMDYIENAQAGLMALGTMDDPTDLTLALDYQIKHILIDEFQDTSNSQYRLIEKLILGWEANDGRTLFLVGDPMQSIYRFREAEVGLFIRAKQIGIAHLPLIPLTLSVNFRSSKTIVDWVNTSFKKIFPSFDDMSSGAVSYSPSIPNRLMANENSQVKLYPFLTHEADQQANTIVDIILHQKKTAPHKKTAILVRSRTHLTEIMSTLKKAHIVYRAIDIDPLTNRQIIQDLISLTRALLRPADRVAWLAVLRAPWCGLTLDDLLVVSGDQNVMMLESLTSLHVTQRLSENGQKKLARIFPIIQKSMNERRRSSLRYWIESTWFLLGGPATALDLGDLQDASAYFELLDQLDQGGDLPSISALNEHVNKLYAAANYQADDTLQIMTIHNAKGLEFDTVILPHLERKSLSDDKQLLLWMERTQQNEKTALILAPTQAIGQDNDSTYDYIKRQLTIKSGFESQRLLYVAATRAKNELHILFNIEKTHDQCVKPTANSLLKMMWPAVKTDCDKMVCDTISDPINTETLLPAKTISCDLLKCLPVNWHNPISEFPLDTSITFHNKKGGFLLPDHTLPLIGIVTHKLLQHLSLKGTHWWQDQPHHTQLITIQNQLRQLGMNKQAIKQAANTIRLAIDNTLADPIGQWILQHHTHAKSEWKLTVIIEGTPVQISIDRTFVDKNNIRWIIDYKTAIPTNPLDMDTFLLKEKKKHQKQIQLYHKAIYELDKRPTYAGLYFPLLNRWIDWPLSQFQCMDGNPLPQRIPH